MSVITGLTFADDMRKAMTYVDKARPLIAKLLNGGEIMPVEGSDAEVCVMLDTMCGTDYFQVYKERGLAVGVASRMQEIDTNRYTRPFNTFTVRKERASGTRTEYEKRRFAIQNGGVYPFLTMQGYVDKSTESIMSLAIAKTTDIMDYIEKGLAETRHTGRDQHGQAEFYVVRWDAFERAGYFLRRYSKGADSN